MEENLRAFELKSTLKILYLSLLIRRMNFLFMVTQWLMAELHP